MNQRNTGLSGITEIASEVALKISSRHLLNTKRNKARFPMDRREELANEIQGMYFKPQDVLRGPVLCSLSHSHCIKMAGFILEWLSEHYEEKK